MLSALTQVFTLPKVSAKTKFKLTAHEGCRVRKVALVSFTSLACEDYTENGLACLTNLGDIHIFTVPGLRPQVHYDCIRKEDISGIASCVFTKHGQGERAALVGLAVAGTWIPGLGSFGSIRLAPGYPGVGDGAAQWVECWAGTWELPSHLLAGRDSPSVQWGPDLLPAEPGQFLGELVR